MIQESMFGMKEPEKNRSIIVVSDMHLGGEEDPHTAWRFCRFLEHIRKGDATVSDPCRAREQSDTGSIPGDKDNPTTRKDHPARRYHGTLGFEGPGPESCLLDTMLPVLKMRDMDYDVVYVAGNHDEDIAELIESCDEDKKKLADERKKMREIREKDHPGSKPLAGCSPSGLRVLRSVGKDNTREA